MATLFRPLSFLLKLYADGGYRKASIVPQRATSEENLAYLKSIKRSDQTKGCLPKRWIVERHGPRPMP